MQLIPFTHTYIHTHTHIYIYILNDNITQGDSLFSIFLATLLETLAVLTILALLYSISSYLVQITINI